MDRTNVLKDSSRIAPPRIRPRRRDLEDLIGLWREASALQIEEDEVHGVRSAWRLGRLVQIHQLKHCVFDRLRMVAADPEKCKLGSSPPLEPELTGV